MVSWFLIYSEIFVEVGWLFAFTSALAVLLVRFLNDSLIDLTVGCLGRF